MIFVMPARMPRTIVLVGHPRRAVQHERHGHRRAPAGRRARGRSRRRVRSSRARSPTATARASTPVSATKRAASSGSVRTPGAWAPSLPPISPSSASTSTPAASARSTTSRVVATLSAKSRCAPSYITEPKPRSIAADGELGVLGVVEVHGDAAPTTPRRSRASPARSARARRGSATQFSEICRMTGRPASSAAPTSASAVSRWMTLNAPMPRPAARASSRSVRVGVSVIGVPRRSWSTTTSPASAAWSGEISPASGMSTAPPTRRSRGGRGPIGARAAASVRRPRSSPAARAAAMAATAASPAPGRVAVQGPRAGGRAAGAPRLGRRRPARRRRARRRRAGPRGRAGRGRRRAGRRGRSPSASSSRFGFRTCAPARAAASSAGAARVDDDAGRRAPTSSRDAARRARPAPKPGRQAAAIATGTSRAGRVLGRGGRAAAASAGAAVRPNSLRMVVSPLRVVDDGERCAGWPRRRGRVVRHPGCRELGSNSSPVAPPAVASASTVVALLVQHAGDVQALAAGPGASGRHPVRGPGRRAGRPTR